MLKEFTADLHIHTCLSPCADIDMSPMAIVKKAVEKKIGIIGVTDHNSAENAGAVIRAAEGTGIKVIPGMEVTTAEEVHILAFFGELSGVLRLQDFVFENLMPGNNRPDFFGEQVVADEHDNVLGFNERLLSTATSLTIDTLVKEIHAGEGLAVGAHIDREGFGIISQLGFIPESLRLDALEISPRTTFETALERYKNYISFPWISFSDAHRLDDIGRRTTVFTMEAPTLAELTHALQNINGRKAVWR
ncbi:MAG: PHP domain-containing protein [Nitrospirae bacterium]|nr:PHP domain-containing protein [Nitrospirota bacterium]